VQGAAVQGAAVQGAAFSAAARGNGLDRFLASRQTHRVPPSRGHRMRRPRPARRHIPYVNSAEPNLFAYSRSRMPYARRFRKSKLTLPDFSPKEPGFFRRTDATGRSDEPKPAPGSAFSHSRSETHHPLLRTSVTGKIQPGEGLRIKNSVWGNWGRVGRLTRSGEGVGRCKGIRV
jgi:hypothetical protein